MHKMSRQFFQETSLHTLTAEVSELYYGKQLEGRKGLPRRFEIPNVGNGLPFVAVVIDGNEAEGLRFVKYRQLNGCMHAIIFND